MCGGVVTVLMNGLKRYLFCTSQKPCHDSHPARLIFLLWSFCLIIYSHLCSFLCPHGTVHGGQRICARAGHGGHQPTRLTRRSAATRGYAILCICIMCVCGFDIHMNTILNRYEKCFISTFFHPLAHVKFSFSFPVLGIASEFVMQSSPHPKR